MNIWNILVTQILYRPVFNILIIFLALSGGQLWIAIVGLTLLVRGLMYKSSAASNNMQQGMSNIQPKVEELQKKYADDPQKLSEETMKLFKTEGKGPFKGCLTMLIQIPVFIGLYTVILTVSKLGSGDLQAINDVHSRLYSFFYSFGESYIDVQNINSNFLWMDLLSKDGGGDLALSIIVTVLYYIQMQLTQITQNKKAMPKIPGASMPDMSKMMSVMNIGMSLMMGLMVFGLNSAVGLYLLTSCLFSICQFSRRYRAILKAKWNERFHKDQPTIIEPK